METRTQKQHDQRLEVKFGLPKEVQFCKICCISNQRAVSVNEYANVKDAKKTTIFFDEEGVCAACRNKEEQHKNVDWEEREQELKALCDRYRRSDGRYDCIIPGSGGKDSIFTSHMLKYKYKMNPLTVTWAPHMYTDIGWKNFQSWLHTGGFDNFLFTPNGRVHRLLTRLAVINLFHPFQPFVLGQKSFVIKMCEQFDIPLAFYGEMPNEYGASAGKASADEKKWGASPETGYTLDILGGKDSRELKLGGVSVDQLIKDYGLSLNDLEAYLPLHYGDVQEKGIEVYYFGYFIKWDPQESYYYAVENSGFEANPVRTEGTYSKYCSLDDKLDGVNFYTTFIKYGMGRTVYDASQEVRNKKITTDEAKALIKKFDGEFPVRYHKDFLEYISMTEQEFLDLCNEFRSPHLWKKVNGEWKLRHTVSNDGADDNGENG